jgi:hypothetical protein
VAAQTPEPAVVPEAVPEPEPEPEPQPQPEPVDVVAEARERASVAGLLPFAEQLAALRDPELPTALDSGSLSGAVNDALPANERSLIASNVGSASGGISTANLSRDTGGSGIGTRATTVVDSPVEGLGPAGLICALPADGSARIPGSCTHLVNGVRFTEDQFRTCLGRWPAYCPRFEDVISGAANRNWQRSGFIEW